MPEYATGLFSCSGLFSLLVILLYSLSTNDGFPLSFPFSFMPSTSTWKPSSQQPTLPVAWIQSPLWAAKRLHLDSGWICLLVIEASAPLVITRHFISDSQLDAFLNLGPRNQIVNDFDTAVPLQESKPLCLLLNDSNLPLNIFHCLKRLDPTSLLVSYWSAGTPDPPWCRHSLLVLLMVKFTEFHWSSSGKMLVYWKCWLKAFVKYIITV